jgi:hypothetical protein
MSAHTAISAACIVMGLIALFMPSGFATGATAGLLFAVGVIGMSEVRR